MKKILRAAPLLLIFALVVAPPSARAYWLPDGVPLCEAAVGRMTPVIVSDGARGAIVAWIELRNGNWDVYAQKISASGTVLWTTGGVALCTATGYQTFARIASDGAGGAIVSWEDPRGGATDIYAQRVNASGVVQWTANGVAVCAATGNQKRPTIASDGAGGAIIVWEDNRLGGAYNDIYAQRVGASGSVLWAADGVSICTAVINQISPTIVSDGAGGAIITWGDARNAYVTGWDIYAQRVDASGAVQWTTDGVPVCAAASEQYNPVNAPDGAGGAVITWQDYRSVSTYDIYVQRVSASGAVQWTTDGVAASTAAGHQQYPVIASDGSGGAVVAWEDDRNGNFDTYAQRVNASGAVAWAANGAALCTATGDQRSPVIANDGANGAIVAWHDYRVANADIYAQRVGAAGSIQWALDGVALCAATGTQIVPAIVSDEARGALVTWSDSRSGVSHIYAQCIDAKGRAGYHGASILSIQDVPGDQGGWVRIDIASSSLDDALEPTYPATTYNVWQRIDDPALLEAAAAEGRHIVRSMDFVETGTFPPGNWELLGSFAAYQQFEYTYRASTVADSMESGVVNSVYMVSVHTTTPSVWFASDPDSGYSVDNIAPGVPPGLLVAYNTGVGNRLLWEFVTDRDFQCFRIYRGADPDFTPAPEYLAGSTSEPRWQDPEYDGWDVHYKVTAVDHAGNESAPAVPMATTGTESDAAPRIFALHQNAPNPFNPETAIRYDVPPGGGRVTIRVFDVSGRLVRTLVDGYRASGSYRERWDGRDASGKSVSSGVYFYRLDAGAFEQTRKMILLR